MRLNCQFKGAFTNLIIQIRWIFNFFFFRVYKKKNAKQDLQFYAVLVSSQAKFILKTLFNNILKSKTQLNH